MKPQPWSVSVLSTVPDLKDIRDSLVSFLEEKGFRPLSFKEPSFPIEPGVDRIEACLWALGAADIVLLLVDKCFGSSFRGNKRKSVTNAEYRQAIERGCVIVPCIRRSAWEDYLRIGTEIKKLRKKGVRSVKRARQQIILNSIDDWAVFDFITEIVTAESDDWVLPFDGPGDLQLAIEGRLQGQTRWWLSKIVRAQKDEVYARKTALNLDLSLGDVLTEGLRIEPPFRVRTGVHNPTETALDLIQSAASKRQSAMLVGHPGTGKSTLLAMAFIENSHLIEIPDNGYDMPFFLSLRARGSYYHFDFSNYINDCFRYYLKKEPYPLIDYDLVRPILYMDGLDEMVDDAAQRKITSSRGDMFDLPFILTCRARNAEALISEMRVSDKITIALELVEWSLDDSNKYVQKYCCQRRLSPKKTALAESLVRNTDLREIARNPLTLTLLMWLVEEGQLENALTQLNTVALYEKCITCWISRELNRVADSLIDTARPDLEAQVRNAWQEAAWQVYVGRLCGKSLTKEDLKGRIDHSKRGSIPEILLFELFDVDLVTGHITGMFHEQFLEHLVAERLVHALTTGDEPFPNFLRYVLRSDVNRMIRGLLECHGSDVQMTVLRNLRTAFDGNSGDMSQEVAVRTHAAYFLTRLTLSNIDAELVALLANEAQTPVCLSLLFGLIKRGHFDHERILVDKIWQNGEWASSNRGYHLAYYGDLVGENLQLPLHDPGSGNWGNTLDALVRHIESSEARHVGMRRVELITIRQFIETRGQKGSVTAELIGRIEQAVAYTSHELPFYSDLEAELALLKRAWIMAPD